MFFVFFFFIKVVSGFFIHFSNSWHLQGIHPNGSNVNFMILKVNTFIITCLHKIKNYIYCSCCCIFFFEIEWVLLFKYFFFSFDLFHCEITNNLLYSFHCLQKTILDIINGVCLCIIFYLYVLSCIQVFKVHLKRLLEIWIAQQLVHYIEYLNIDL